MLTKVILLCCAFGAVLAEDGDTYIANKGDIEDPGKTTIYRKPDAIFNITKEGLDVPSNCFTHRRGDNYSQQIQRFQETGILELGVDFYMPKTGNDTMFETTLRIIEPDDHDDNFFTVRDFTCQISSYSGEYYSVFSRQLLQKTGKVVDNMHIEVFSEIDGNQNGEQTIKSLTEDLDDGSGDGGANINLSVEPFLDTSANGEDYQDTKSNETVNDYTTVAPEDPSLVLIKADYPEITEYTMFNKNATGHDNPVAKKKNSRIVLSYESSRGRRDSGDSSSTMFKLLTAEAFHTYGELTINNYWTAIKNSNNDTSFLTYLSHRIEDLANLFPNVLKERRVRLLSPLATLAIPNNKDLNWIEDWFKYFISEPIHEDEVMFVKTGSKKFSVSAEQWKEAFAILDEWYNNVKERLLVIRIECRSLASMLFGMALKELNEREVFKCQRMDDESEIVKCFQECYYDRMARSDHNQIILGALAEISVKIHRIAVEKNLLTNFENAKFDLKQGSSSNLGTQEVHNAAINSTIEYHKNNIALHTLEPEKEKKYEYTSTTTVKTSPNSTVTTTTMTTTKKPTSKRNRNQEKFEKNLRERQEKEKQREKIEQERKQKIRDRVNQNLKQQEEQRKKILTTNSHNAPRNPKLQTLPLLENPAAKYPVSKLPKVTIVETIPFVYL